MNITDFDLEVNEGQDYVEYYLYKDDRPIKEKYIPFPEDSHKNHPSTKSNNGTRDCFSSLLDYKKKHPLNNRLCFEFSDEGARVKLDPTKRKRWLFLSRVNGFLPRYTSVGYTLAKNKFVLDLSKHSPNELYVYLTTLRSMVAEPNHVSNLLKLVDTFSFDYFTATVVAAKLSYGNSNHHFLPARQFSYPCFGKEINKLSIDTSLIKAFVLFIRSLSYGFCTGNHFTGFTCNHTIERFQDFERFQDSKYAEKGLEELKISDNLNTKAAKIVQQTIVDLKSMKDSHSFIKNILT